jgi:hypothetical protein
LAKDRNFQSELHQAQDRAVDQAISLLAGENVAAATTLVEINRDLEAPPSVRVQAAQAILSHKLKMREQRFTDERITSMELIINELRQQAATTC